MYAVNKFEAMQILLAAKTILLSMADPVIPAYKELGPPRERKSFANTVKDARFKSGAIQGPIRSNLQSRYQKTPVYFLFNDEEGENEKHLVDSVSFLFEALTLRKPEKAEVERYLSLVEALKAQLGTTEGTLLGISAIFLESDFLFRSELANYGEAEKYGRVMLQGEELAFAINAAFAYIDPDKKLKEALAAGKLKTREDVRREITRILKDDSFREPRVIQFFREFFDYDPASKICKDEEALKAGGGMIHSGNHYWVMNRMIVNTDRLIEMIVDEDKNVLKELLTTDRVIYGDKPGIYKSMGGWQGVEYTDPVYFRNRDTTGIAIDFSGKYCKDKHDPSRKEVLEINKIIRHERSGIYTKRLEDEPENLGRLPADQRMGILTYPVWLVARSDAMDNHAILRGKWIRERLLGDAVPDVPIMSSA